MTKLIVVCGATGGLGGAVARRMLSEGWRVRGIGTARVGRVVIPVYVRLFIALAHMHA